ncbi:MAG: hypothetical protein JNJ92_06900 [Altererythrobacter sp.]|nr:hypothetical protein [Altererythrobacter sp.]
MTAFSKVTPETGQSPDGPVSVIAGGQVRRQKNLSLHANWEISKDRDSDTFSTRFAQILASLARKSIDAIAIPRALIA